jgi:t-SNARE complex subunit (syntaxin)
VAAAEAAEGAEAASARRDAAAHAILRVSRHAAILEQCFRTTTSRSSWRHHSIYVASSDGSALSWRTRTMASKETKRKIREEVRADQARYDDVTRRMLERIEHYRRKTQDRRESS